MKIQNKNCRRTNWLKKPILAEFYQDWLVDDGSLTARLQKSIKIFQLKKYVYNMQNLFQMKLRYCNTSATSAR